MNTMTKISRAVSKTILLMMIFAFALTFKTYAAEILWDSYEVPATRQKPRLVDNADLLTDSEETALLQKLDATSEKWQSNIAILTVNSHNGPIQDYADDYFDYNGFCSEYNESGILFMLSMEDREWAISSSGSAQYAFTDYGQDYLFNEMRGDLSDGDYYDAFNTYVEQCDRLLYAYSQGTPVDVGVKPPKTTSDILGYLVGSIAVGLVVALFPILKMKSDLKTVKMAGNAAGYAKGKLHMSIQQDRFVRKTLSKTEIPRDNGSSNGSRGGGFGGGSTLHTSSSGHSHGGSHGHF
ncbi:TPM domain-containing protein [Butyrivibrio sp. CB08]|uniref:TPM domain-containing protein n=1 Tax=Butyrivibrio sp. CB08 TaxID=2364879 RepID=UPI000EA8675C|nr:TPM domain-containing protein [Butyrivibrio sp. CB08]RKM55948.1 TPM domain-containing protein [Butyrivibrio sp. CB08]